MCVLQRERERERERAINDGVVGCVFGARAVDPCYYIRWDALGEEDEDEESASVVVWSGRLFRRGRWWRNVVHESDINRHIPETDRSKGSALMAELTNAKEDAPTTLRHSAAR